MTAPGRDLIGRAVFVAVGAAIGLRGIQVVRNFNEQGSYSTIAAGGTLIGLGVAIAFVGGLAVWRNRRSPQSTGGTRLLALAAGMIIGGVAGGIVFGAS